MLDGEADTRPTGRRHFSERYVPSIVKYGRNAWHAGRASATKGFISKFVNSRRRVAPMCISSGSCYTMSCNCALGGPASTSTRNKVNKFVFTLKVPPLTSLQWAVESDSII